MIELVLISKQEFLTLQFVLDIATIKENNCIGSGLKQEEAGAPEQTVYITQIQACSLE